MDHSPFQRSVIRALYEGSMIRISREQSMDPIFCERLAVYIQREASMDQVVGRQSMVQVAEEQSMIQIVVE